jgi:hypothetical protein
MSTLVIHAPQNKADTEGKRSFEGTLESGVGDEYAIYQNLYRRLSPGDRVIVLDKDRELRAEGILLTLEPKSTTGNGIQRYNVRIKNLKAVPYKSERLNRCGVSVI